MIYKRLFRPILFRMDAEKVHDYTIRAMAAAEAVPAMQTLVGACCRRDDERLATEVAGIRFANPIGLAAGYDKNGRAIGMLGALGFGFIEIGSVSADPSAGNPRPRLWRFPQDRAVGVHYGLPNDGAEAVARRLAGKKRLAPLGINVVKTNRGLHAPPETGDAILQDYIHSVVQLQDACDYLSLNLSCPNTDMGRDFFSAPGNLGRLLEMLKAIDIRRPVFLKISPLGGISAMEQVLAECDPFPFVRGFMFNLSPLKPSAMRTPGAVWESLPGAVSGEPARQPLDDCLRELYRRMDRKRYRLIAAGGVFSAQDAYQKIQLGASLVELLTGMIYEGPLLVRKINRDLSRLLERDGFKNVSEAVGIAHGTV